MNFAYEICKLGNIWSEWPCVKHGCPCVFLTILLIEPAHSLEHSHAQVIWRCPLEFPTFTKVSLKALLNGSTIALELPASGNPSS